jgi:hypothetical protein
MSDDLARPPEVGTHRFRDWHSGLHYAFARGLAVSPQHLPEALDAMEEAGWSLAAVFGKTSAEEIGFLFKRKLEN